MKFPFNKHQSIGLPILLSAGLLIPASAILAQDAAPDASALVQELQGQGAPQTRTPAQAVTAYSQVLESLLPDMSSDDLTKQGAAQNTWERIALRAGRPGAPTERVAAVQAMLGKIGPATPQVVRLWLEKQLEHIGRAEAVPALAGLLGDADVLVAERARRALSNNPSPEAAAALRAALDRAPNSPRRIAMIDALAYRRDALAVPALTRLLADPDNAVAATAAAALGRIGTPRAGEALTSFAGKASPALRGEVIDAAIIAAERLLRAGNRNEAATVYQALFAPAQPKIARIAALRGLVAARGVGALPALNSALNGTDADLRGVAGTVVELLPAAATPALAASLPKLTPEGQVVLLDALALRGDATVRPAIMTATKNASPAVRIAALRALGSLGSGADVLLLARLAGTTTGAEADAARASLNRLRGADVPGIMVRSMNGADVKTRAVLINSLAARRIATAVPALLQSAGDADGSVRLEALNALGVLAGVNEVPALVRSLSGAKSDDERQAAEKALTAVTARLDQKDAAAAPLVAALATANPALQTSLLRVLGTTGTETALSAARRALKDPSNEVQDAAVRSLAAWPNDAAAKDLIELAKNSPSQIFPVLALRGYVRMVGASSRTPGEKVDQYGQALAVAKRPDEKKLAISGLGELSDAAALQLVGGLLDEADLREEAAAAVAKIATNLGGSDANTRPVLEKVVKVSKNNDTIKQAAEILRKNNQPRREWLVLGPFAGGTGAFDTVFEPEKGIDANKAYSVAGGQTARWKSATSRDTGYVDLNAQFQPNQEAVGYATIYVKSPTARQALISAGSDDGLKTWINGKQVIATNGTRAAAPGQDEANVDLKAGWNEVLLKITQSAGDWGFYFDLLDANHLPLADLTFSTRPQG